jgi:twitching motility protein PilJ
MSFIQWFYNLPISRKQLYALITAQLVSIVGIGVGSTLIITIGLRSQLLEQAKAEVAVTDINYNIKINQMGFGFRGQSDNPSIIKAAIAHDSNQPLAADVKNEVKKILANEIKARKIEYATLVGRDFKIITNANSDRTGEIFNPDNLVSEIINNPKQIKANGIVTWSDIQKESPPLPDGFINQDGLICYTVTPVFKDAEKTQVVGALISGDIVNGKDPIVRGTVKATGNGYSAVYLRKPNGEFTLATSLDKGFSLDLNKAQRNVELPPEGKAFLEATVKAPEGTSVTGRISVAGQTYTVAAKVVPNKIIEEADGSKLIYGNQPVAILVKGTSEAALNNLLFISLLEQIGTILVALCIVGFCAFLLRRAIGKRIEDLQRVTQDFANGNSNSRAKSIGTDEIGDLAITFNIMADSITEEAKRRENQAKLAVQLNEITAKMRETLNLDKILKAAVNNTRKTIGVDRVLFYSLGDNWEGTVITEAVNNNVTLTLGGSVKNPYLIQEYAEEEFELGSVKAVENIYEGRLSQYFVKQLEPLSVKGFILAPVYVNKKLRGLLVAHQCSNYRHWEDLEINLFRQVAIQIGFALEQGELLQRIEKGRLNAENTSQSERKEKEELQLQILELLNSIEGAASGDLTVRADVREGEIGTVADFFNSIVESLRAIVTQVKTSANQVNNAIGENEGEIRLLAEEALKQANEINHTLDTVDNMTASIKSVAQSAKEAAIVASNAAVSAEESEQAMDKTVQSIMYLRETVGNTAKKVKCLGESTQQITRVVSLINQIAMQTNLLAINAGIEAGRAGEEGQGFAVVAEEVGELASRSASATVEIEQIVDNIQRETNELVQAIEEGTSQVVKGTHIVEDAKQSLNQILQVSRYVDSLVQSISLATTSQVETSQTVSNLMKDIAKVSQRTSESSRKVSQSLQQTVNISQDLKETVETFKVS